MVWKGIILEESLDDRKILDLARIVGTEVRTLRGDNRLVTFHMVELSDDNKNTFLIEAMKVMKRDAFYAHICQKDEIYIIYRNALFNFREGEIEAEKAREYGRSLGILPIQMFFENLIKYPFHPFEGNENESFERLAFQFGV